MTREGADLEYGRQRQLISDLVGVVSADPEQHLDSIHIDLWKTAANSKAQKRVVIDQIASLTDVSLAQWHQNLCN
jgi:dGTPase